MSHFDPASKEYRKIAKAYVDKLKAEYPKAFNFYNQEQRPIRNSTPKGAPRSRMSLDKKLGPLTTNELEHLLRRTRFIVKRDEIAFFLGMDVDGIMNELLRETSIELPVNNYDEIEEDPEVALGETIINAPYVSVAIETARISTLKFWAMDDMFLGSERSIHASMWFFWQNHVPIQMWDVFYAWGSYRYLKILRDQALGNFKQMMIDVTIEPAMLIYLNGTYNVASAPDENYARELQELFCIGKGPDAGFQEQDVVAAARVLTGWSINGYGNEVVFHDYDHDTEDKQFSSYYDNRVIQGREGDAGGEEYLELIDMIFEKDEVSKFICRRLYRYYCYAEIDEWTEENIISPLAQTYRESNYEIVPVLEQLLSSEHFYDELNHSAIIKSPLDFGAMLINHTTLPHYKENRTQEFQYKQSMFWQIASLGLQLVDPPNVSGWPAYYQAPTYDKYWITTATVTDRIEKTDSLVWWGFWTKYGKEEWDVIELVRQFANGEDPNEVIAESEQLFLGMRVSDESRAALKSVLLSGQQTDTYWTEVWVEYNNDESNEELRNIILNRLKPFYQRFFQLAEVHLK